MQHNFLNSYDPRYSNCLLHINYTTVHLHCSGFQDRTFFIHNYYSSHIFNDLYFVFAC